MTDKYNPYMFNKSDRVMLREDMIKSARCIIANAEVCAISLVEKAIRDELDPDVPAIDKRAMAKKAQLWLDIAERLNAVAKRHTEEEMDEIMQTREEQRVARRIPGRA